MKFHSSSPRYLLVSIVVILSIFSCQQEKESEKIHLTCDLVEEMLESDQYYRKTKKLYPPYTYMLDSLLVAAGYSGWSDLKNFDIKEQEAYREKAQRLADNIDPAYMTRRDSLFKLQIEIDTKNTKKLMQIVEDTGYPALDTMAYDCAYRSFMVFLHTPEELLDEVRVLVEKGQEHIGEGQYNHLMWHLKGRHPEDIK